MAVTFLSLGKLDSESIQTFALLAFSICDGKETFKLFSLKHEESININMTKTMFFKK